MDSGKRLAIPTALVFAVVAALTAWLVTATHEWSRDRIAANERARVAARLSSVLDPALASRDLTTIPLRITDPALLGAPAGTDAWLMRSEGLPVAVIMTVVAPHGYNSAIRLLIGIDPNGTLMGARVIAHRETPGLGDQIDVAKSPWIRQFDGKSIGMPPLSEWVVEQDEGAFDSITGATVTSRAVVAAVKNALLYFGLHRDELLTATAAENGRAQ
jgi:electron transport complex protein RnfG